MTLEEAAQRYWTWSQHMRLGLRTQAERENFVLFTVQPSIAAARPPLTGLLERLRA